VQQNDPAEVLIDAGEQRSPQCRHVVASELLSEIGVWSRIGATA
jgi:hypothetical protein